MKDIILPEIITCGYFNCREEFGDLKRSPERTAGCIEIEFFLEDGYSTFIDGIEHRILKNRVIVAKEGSKRYSLLPFKTVYLKLAARGELKSILSALPDCFQAVHSERITELLGEIVILSREKQRNELLIGAKILTLADILVKDAKRGNLGGVASYELMHRAKKLIEKRFAEKLSTSDIAREISLSESRFRYLFGKTYGISPRQYLTDVRISNAKLLMWEELSMSEIAERCGFGCQQYFCDVFKRETGLSPTGYKLQLARDYYR